MKNEEQLQYILSLIDGEQRKKYAQKHGIDSLLNKYHGTHWNDEESERVYKICNEKGITWEEYYGVKDDERRIY